MQLQMTWGELARAAGGELVRGKPSDPFRGLSTDSRTVSADQAFWALRGERFDAHDFLDARLAEAADGWVVRRGVTPAVWPRRMVAVPDTLKALGDLAAHHRRRFKIPVVGITGSNGKTTTKEMLRSILAEAAGGPDAVCANAGNFNNEVGLPLTVLELKPSTRYAVFEMGASKKGDIAYLARIAQPTAGILTNIGTAHLEFFGSLEGTFRAKTELFDGLPPGAPAVFNGEDPYLSRLSGRPGLNGISFGEKGPARVRAVSQGPGRFEIQLPSGNIPIRKAGFGRIHRLNAAAAAAAADALGLSAETIRKGIEGYAPSGLRFTPKRHASGAWLVVDAYNANPDSMRAGIGTFLETAPELMGGDASPELWVVLGDMKELGPGSGRMHRELGAWLAGLGLAGAYLLGDGMAEAAAGLKEGGARFPVVHAGAPDDLLKSLRGRLKPGAAIFFKASRAMRLEELIEKL